MQYRQLIHLIFPVFFLSPLFWGCATPEGAEHTAPAVDTATIEKIDSSCSYFYFLWGSHAEANQRFDEALEAYEKASICDPGTEYIAEKIPYLLIQTGRIKEAEIWLMDYISSHPDKILQRFMLARLKIQEDKIEEAIVLYRQTLELEPENSNIKLQLGLLYGRQEDYKAAEQIFKSILQSDPNSYFATLYLARLYSKTGQLDLARLYYISALDSNWSKELAYELADFYTLRKQFADALAIYTSVLENDDKDERAALGLVQTHLYLNNKEAALKELARIRTITDSPERMDLVRSQILINTGELDRAKEILHSLLKNSDLAQANYLLGVLYYEEGNFVDALAALKAIAPASSEYKDSVILQVRIYEETNKSDQSISLLQAALSSEDAKIPLFYSILSSIFQRQDRVEDALKTLKEGTEAFADDDQILHDYAVLLEKSGQHDRAFALMESLVSRNPNHADALNFIGYTLADRSINLEKAYEYILKASQLKPESGYILDSLGWVYFRMGRFYEARVELEKAITMEPKDPFIYEHLGDTYRALNNPVKARESYQKAMELFTEEQKIRSIQEKLNGLD